jgi:hypothetical protein
VDKIIEKVKSYGANAVVIDIKNDLGETTYAINAPGVKIAKKCIPDLRALLNTLKNNGIYTVGRIVAFKDSVRTDTCIKNKDGSLWIDKEKSSWLNPYDMNVWVYLKNIAVQAVKDGFDEIQFDYIRFSSYLKDMPRFFRGNNLSFRARQDVINQFLDYVCRHIHALGAAVSVDVFGCVIEGTTDTPENPDTARRSALILGQNYVEIARRVDYICPMIYPSHYPNDTPFGIKYPDLEPYNVVRATMLASNNMLKGVDQKPIATVRPYLQAFTAKWLSNYQKYGRAQIFEQIKAVEDVGLKQWGLFNFSLNYP